MRRAGVIAPLSVVIAIAALTAATSAVPAQQGRGRGGPPAVTSAPRPKAIFANADPVRSCESLTSVALPDTTIDSAAVDKGDERAPASCRVTATVTHPPAGDHVKIFLALPMTGWNGRFQGTGGGGFSGGGPNSLRLPLTAGYAAGSTDTGHEGGRGSFALDSNGRLNWQLIRDNAYLGIHAMTVTGKALTRELYGKAPRYSYFNGCSTGGRQGLMEAQRYPADYDGILSGAPAINWPKLHVEQLWGHLVMLEAKNVMPQCKLDAAAAAALAACDGNDGVQDGVVEDQLRCKFDPKALVGTTAGACAAFTDADADVIQKIWDGPKRRDGSFLWYGLPRGASFALSATSGPPPLGRPFEITLDWFRFFLTQNPDWNWQTMTHAAYEQFWDQSVEQFGPVFGTDNPELSAFRDRGGRIVLWHGWADPLIYAEGTIDYVKRVQQQMGGAEKASSFIRLFMAPGVGHCGGGAGPAPTGQFEAVVRWVEEGKAPDTLDAVKRDQAGTVVRSRLLCQYPLVSRYKGRGILMRLLTSSAKRVSDVTSCFHDLLRACGSSILTLTVLLTGTAVGAQQPAPAAQTPQTPTGTSGDYEPKVGQAGKDVVWVPSPEATVERMLEVAKVTPQDYVIDLGSGDGRNVIAAAKRGARAHGVEYNPDMVDLSRRNAAKAGVAERATFSQGDMYEADFSQATVLALFLLPDNLSKLRTKFAGLPPGTRIVANTFGIEGWTADETVEITDGCTSWCTVLLYFVPAKVSGTWEGSHGTLVLNQEFQTVSGTLGTVAIQNGRVKGEQITFAAGGAEYTGRLQGSTLKGTVKTGTSEAEWTAKRASK